MNKKIATYEWEPKNNYAKENIDKRIKSCVAHRGWQHAIKLIHELGKSFGDLNIAEVGCGTGTFALTLGLLGTSVTLIDYNEKVLDNSKRIFDLYNCKANFVKADCINAPSDELKESFDIVVSRGLAEHFIGLDREKCIEFHKDLVNEKGFVFISAPNRYSPNYRIIRLFRQLIGVWRISIEIPFSNKEFRMYANKLNFSRYYILGTMPLYKDLKIHLRGIISAIGEIIPQILRHRLINCKKYLMKKTKSATEIDIVQDMKEYCRNKANEAWKGLFKQDILSDKYSSGIILFAFKHYENKC